MLPSRVRPGHPDFEALIPIKDGIVRLAGGESSLRQAFPQTVRDAIDFVLDPVRTGRTLISELDNVEKTFVGLKIEHFVRDLLDAPKGLRDLVIDGKDVDIKNTLDNSWMIPPETFRNEDPCLVINSKEDVSLCWMGVMLARETYLNAPNRDGKRGVRADAIADVLWIVEGEKFPESVWLPFDMSEFRELREGISGGTKRISEFFRRNLEKPIHRSVVQALLFDQYDYMKRVRGNGGARDVLRTEGIAVLSGVYDGSKMEELRRQKLSREEVVAIAPRSAQERYRMIELDLIDG